MVIGRNSSIIFASSSLTSLLWRFIVDVVIIIFQRHLAEVA